MRHRTLGIIGGMGNEATVDLMLRVIKATPGRDEQNHIRMLVDNNPKLPSRIKTLVDGTGESPAPTLISMARGLAGSGADFLAIPSNTVHYYLREVQESADILILNMIGWGVQHRLRQTMSAHPKKTVKTTQTQDQETRSMVEWMLKDIPSVGEFISTAAKSPTPDRAE
jgi:aspartate/glutamate racemase